MSQTDFRKDMPAITVPTLIIHGTSDKTVPIAPTAEVAAKMISNSKLIRYEGSPHGLFFTQQKLLCEDIISFIKETQPYEALTPDRETFIEEQAPQF